MKIFKKLFGCKKLTSCEKKPNYYVCEHKDKKGCVYYTAQVKHGGSTYDCSSFGDAAYKADMRLYWAYRSTSTGYLGGESYRKVRFKCPEVAKEKCIEYLREKQNLSYCKVVRTGEVDAEINTSDC